MAQTRQSFHDDSSTNSAWKAATGRSAGKSIADVIGSSTKSGSAAGTSSAAGVSSSGISGSWYDTFRSISDANNAFNLDQVHEVNAFNAAEAQKNRDWQEMMSNTAHQREVKDLIAAGLNPILSAGGQGAVTGSGATASGQRAIADNTLGNGVVSLMNSLISAASAQSVAQTYAAANMYGTDKNYALGMLKDSHSTGSMLYNAIEDMKKWVRYGIKFYSR